MNITPTWYAKDVDTSMAYRVLEIELAACYCNPADSRRGSRIDSSWAKRASNLDQPQRGLGLARRVGGFNSQLDLQLPQKTLEKQVSRDIWGVSLQNHLCVICVHGCAVRRS